MSAAPSQPGGARKFDVGCTVRVAITSEELFAEVVLDDGLEIGPGDRVLVHGEEIHPQFGEVLEERRRATVTRASWLGRTWVRLTGDLECFELIDVSFTDRRTL